MHLLLMLSLQEWSCRTEVWLGADLRKKKPRGFPQLYPPLGGLPSLSCIQYCQKYYPTELMDHSAELTGKYWYEEAGDKHHFQLNIKINANICGKYRYQTIIVMIFEEKLNNVFKNEMNLMITDFEKNSKIHQQERRQKRWREVGGSIRELAPNIFFYSITLRKI